VSARNPIKCPICAESNRVSGLRKLSREDLAKLRARRSGEISRAKSRVRNRACEIAWRKPDTSLNFAQTGHSTGSREGAELDISHFEGAKLDTSHSAVDQVSD